MSYCPTLPKDGEMIAFLQALGINWPAAPANWTNEEKEEKIQEALENSPYREKETERGRRTSGGGGGRKAEEGENEGELRVNLKRVFQEEGLLGYDPSLGTCTGEGLSDSDVNSRIKCLSFLLQSVVYFLCYVWLMGEMGGWGNQNTLNMNSYA